MAKRGLGGDGPVKQLRLDHLSEPRAHQDEAARGTGGGGGVVFVLVLLLLLLWPRRSCSCSAAVNPVGRSTRLFSAAKKLHWRPHDGSATHFVTGIQCIVCTLLRWQPSTSQRRAIATDSRRRGDPERTWRYRTGNSCTDGVMRTQWGKEDDGLSEVDSRHKDGLSSGAPPGGGDGRPAHQGRRTPS